MYLKYFICKKLTKEGENTKTSHIQFIDELRGLAAFFVLFQHVFEQTFSGFKSWSLSYLNFGIIGVLIFFLVSGYIIAHSGKDKPVGLFICNRFFRIFPLFWVVLCLEILGLLWHTNISPTFLTVIGNFFLVHLCFGLKNYVGGSWTLPLEFLFYCGFIFWWKIPNFRKQSVLIAFTFFILSALVLAGILLDIRIPLGRPLFILAAFFTASKYLSKFEASFMTSKKEQAIHFLILCAAFLWWAFGMKRGVFDPLCILISWTVGYCLFVCLMRFQLGGIFSRVLQWMGRVSYSVYLIQGLVYTWFYYLEIPTQWFWIAFPLTYSLSPLFYQLIEVPGIRLGKWIYQKLQASLAKLTLTWR